MNGRILILRTLPLLACLALPLLTDGSVPGSHDGPASIPAPPRKPASEPAQPDLSDYRWPVDEAHVVTSTFGEYRRTHFHGGIDISTRDRIGLKVFAARDGYVARIRVSPVGYGKILYLRHPDGYMTLYAHLEKFSPPLEARTMAEQQRLGSYPVDFACGPGEFPVHKGELIAYSGRSGTASPHLHFELRDGSMNPVNPLLSPNLGILDDIPPVIMKIAVTPIGEHSLVDAVGTPRIYRARPDGRGNFSVRETINVTEAAGFAIAARDRSDGTWFKHGVFGYSLFIDNQLLYSVRLTTVPADDDQQIGLYYDWNLADRGRGRFERLYLETPGLLKFSQPRSSGAGILRAGEFPDGLHTFRIVSEDFNGNKAEVTGRVILNRQPEISVERIEDTVWVSRIDTSDTWRILIGPGNRGNGGAASLMSRFKLDGGTTSVAIPLRSLHRQVVSFVAENSWGTISSPRFVVLGTPVASPEPLSLEHELHRDYVRLTLRTPGIISSPASLVVSEGTEQRTFAMDQLESGRCTVTFRPLESYAGTRQVLARAEVNGHPETAQDEFTLYPIVPGKAGTLALDSGRCEIAYDSAAVFAPVYMSTENEAEDGETVYSLLPSRTVLFDGVRVALRLDRPSPKAGLFFRSRGGWSLIAGPVEGDSELIAGTLHRTLGDVALLVDDEPPRITNVDIRQARRGRPAISFRFSDDLSGIEYDELKMYIDGRAVIPEIDGVRHRALYSADQPLERGPHQLTIRLKDKLGNASTAERRFVVR